MWSNLLRENPIWQVLVPLVLFFWSAYEYVLFGNSKRVECIWFTWIHEKYVPKKKSEGKKRFIYLFIFIQFVEASSSMTSVWWKGRATRGLGFISGNKNGLDVKR